MVNTGRKTKLTAGLERKIVKYVKAGNYIKTVCQAVGVEESTFYRWLQRAEKGEEPFASFASRLYRAKNIAEIALVIKIRKAASDPKYFEDPQVLKELLKASSKLKLAFLRGNFDIRARISQADRFPNEGRLRVALQVGTRATKFGKTILKMLKDDFYIESATPEWGASRDRDNMIRMNPRDLNIDFFSSPWKKLLLKDFQEYNKKNFPGYISQHSTGQQRLLK